MKKILFLLLFIVLALSVRAEDDSARLYVGLHGNKTNSKFWDADEYRSGATGKYRMDNGDTGATSFSITGGLEIVNKLIETFDDLKMLGGGELFFDHINKTVVQGDRDSDREGFVSPRPMANKAIFKNKYLLGARGKAGIRLFQRADIYGHAGLAYWERDWYLDRERVYGKFYEDPNWKILPVYGLGCTIQITDHWAANINYTIIRQTLDIGTDRNLDSYRYNDPKIGINILTVGAVYYF